MNKDFNEAIKLITSGKVSQGVKLDFRFNQMDKENVTALATALASGKMPRGLVLVLVFNQIGEEGAKALASALESGNAPPGLEIKLWENRIGDEGAKALATALTQSNVPQGLKLDLWENQISKEGEKALAQQMAYLDLFAKNKKIVIEGIDNNMIKEAKAQLIKKATTLTLCIKKFPNSNNIDVSAIRRDLFPSIMFFANTVEPAQSKLMTTNSDECQSTYNII